LLTIHPLIKKLSLRLISLFAKQAQPAGSSHSGSDIELIDVEEDKKPELKSDRRDRKKSRSRHSKERSSAKKDTRKRPYEESRSSNPEQKIHQKQKSEQLKTHLLLSLDTSINVIKYQPVTAEY
jgi:hypothetical protein